MTFASASEAESGRNWRSWDVSIVMPDAAGFESSEPLNFLNSIGFPDRYSLQSVIFVFSSGNSFLQTNERNSEFLCMAATALHGILINH